MDVKVFILETLKVIAPSMAVVITLLFTFKKERKQIGRRIFLE